MGSGQDKSFVICKTGLCFQPANWKTGGFFRLRIMRSGWNLRIASGKPYWRVNYLNLN
jgi:hypothetical protein